MLGAVDSETPLPSVDVSLCLCVIEGVRRRLGESEDAVGLVYRLSQGILTFLELGTRKCCISITVRRSILWCAHG